MRASISESSSESETDIHGALFLSDCWLAVAVDLDRTAVFSILLVSGFQMLFEFSLCVFLQLREVKFLNFKCI